MSFLPQPEAPGPNPGQPGHYADHEWLTLCVNALDDALMGMASGGTLLGTAATGGDSTPGSTYGLRCAMPPFTLDEPRNTLCTVSLFGYSGTPGCGISSEMRDNGAAADGLVAVWAESSFPAHQSRTFHRVLDAGPHTLELWTAGYGAVDSMEQYAALVVWDMGPASAADLANNPVWDVQMPEIVEE